MTTQKTDKKLVRFAQSFVIFVTVMLLFFNLEVGLIITFSLLLHETGHWLVLRSYGYSAGMVFNPLFGAAVRPDDKNCLEKLSRRQVFVLAGIGPAINLSLCLGGLALLAAGGPTTAARVLILVNALLALTNLIPFGPLDGGKMVESILASLRGSEEAVLARGLMLASSLVTFAAAAWGGTRIWLFTFALMIAAYKVAARSKSPRKVSGRAMSKDLAHRFASAYGLMLGVSITLLWVAEGSVRI